MQCYAIRPFIAVYVYLVCDPNSQIWNPAIYFRLLLPFFQKNVQHFHFENVL